jgi:hypothetical protein
MINDVTCVYRTIISMEIEILIKTKYFCKMLTFKDSNLMVVSKELFDNNVEFYSINICFNTVYDGDVFILVSSFN